MGEDEILEISMAFEMEIKSQIILDAGCNQNSDHYVLGYLCLEIARELEGLIDFGGDLAYISPGIPAKLGGSFHEITYNQGSAKYQVADVIFMENFFKHPHFRMIK